MPSGVFESRRVSRGAPQGSVLETAPVEHRNYVLRISWKGERPGCFIIGYADDTLVMCAGNMSKAVQSNINTYLRLVTRRIEFLSFEMAADKTEVVLTRRLISRDRRRLVDADPVVRIGNTVVPITPSMKYLGVVLDCKLNFKQHFLHIGKKVGRVSRALGHLMPNLRGPMEKKRRLYTGIIASVVLYAALIWADSLVASRDSRKLFRQWQRVIALRVCAAYRSVSFDSVTLLARLVPYELLTAERACIFWRVQDVKEIGPYTPEARGHQKI